LKQCPFDLPLSQAKYFYNLHYFFHYQNFGLADLIEALNFRVTTKPYVFLAIVVCPCFFFISVGKDILIDKFWLVLLDSERLGNVYGFMRCGVIFIEQIHYLSFLLHF